MRFLGHPLVQPFGLFFILDKEFDKTLLKDVSTFRTEPVDRVFTLGGIDGRLGTDSPPALSSRVERDEVVQNRSGFRGNGKIAEWRCGSSRIAAKVPGEEGRQRLLVYWCSPLSQRLGRLSHAIGLLTHQPRIDGESTR